MNTTCTRTTVAAVPLVVIAALAGTASAGVESHPVNYFWDVNNGNERLRIDVNQFDDQGGTRLLENVHISIESDWELEMLAENLEDRPITSDEWFVEAAILLQVWIEEDFQAFIGGVGVGVFSADLEAADSAKLEGPDSIFWHNQGELDGTFDVAAPDLTRFVGEDTIEVGVYPFLSLAITPPPPLFDLWILDHINAGTLTVQYGYSSIPTPGALAVFGFAAISTRRRRR